MKKDEMINSIKKQIAEENVSDKISEFFLILKDENDGSFISAAMCSNAKLLMFLASGIEVLAKKSNKDVAEVGMDIVRFVVLRKLSKQPDKEEE